MNVQQKNKEKGFTIIEVVLVLAIAGLIFLMVFIALPALQRSQRDTQRRDDVSRFISQLNSYATNNRGKIPSSAAELTTFKTSYLKWAADGSGEFNDPSTGIGYVINYGVGQPNAEGQINYSSGATCDGETMKSGGTARDGAVIVRLEGSGFFCTTSN
jgi:prepilin-type N-terminal cleavage/methylation domain-containing protein